MRNQDKVFYTFNYYKKDFWADLRKIFKSEPDPEWPVKKRLLITFFIFGGLPVVFALVMFRYAYRKLNLQDRQHPPYLHHHVRPIYAGMIFGAGIWSIIILLLYFRIGFPWISLLEGNNSAPSPMKLIFLPYFAFNTIIALISWGIYKRWRAGIIKFLAEVTRHGSASFASAEEFEPYSQPLNKKGFYIGGGFLYNKPGHLLTVAGTRGGKGTNLIIPNLTRLGRFEGSWIVIDPKGENAAITARIQAKSGKKVIILNPWELHLLESGCYNPIDLIGDNTKSLDFIDDVQLIAEMVIPIELKNSNDKFFKDRARSILVGLLVHLVVSQPKEKRTFTTIWEWLRLPEKDWQDLLATMASSDNDIAKSVANEVLTLMASEKTYVSVISTLLDETDFLKSPALQKSLATSGFSATDLTDGNTIVYVIIPADKLKTHAKWLRLIVTSTLRGVIRKPNKDVCFLLDEFYALGYISEIDVALGAYAGYGVHIWAILQNLIQLKSLYGDNWESFISSCSVRHFFNMSDNFTADYVSAMFGKTTVPKYNSVGIITDSTQRQLVNPDELRRQSGENIFAVVDDLPPAKIPKVPYYAVLKEGEDYDRNPFLK